MQDLWERIEEVAISFIGEREMRPSTGRSTESKLLLIALEACKQRLKPPYTTPTPRYITTDRNEA